MLPAHAAQVTLSSDVTPLMRWCHATLDLLGSEIQGKLFRSEEYEMLMRIASYFA